MGKQLPCHSAGLSRGIQLVEFAPLACQVRRVAVWVGGEKRQGWVESRQGFGQGGTVKTFVIVNPEAAGGRGLRHWARLSDKIFETIGLFEYEFTNAVGAATVLAHQAAKGGFERIIAVGGDGTVNEVINGLFESDGTPVNPRLVLGCLPFGSGTDYWRSLGFAEKMPEALAHLASRTIRAVDVGRVALHMHDGRVQTRFFCNMADVGLGGVVVERMQRLPRLGVATLNYFVATLVSFWQWEPAVMQITVDGKALPAEKLVVALVAKGQYYGGGMWIAPKAALDDGHLHLVLVPAVSRARLFELVPKLYTGRLDRVDGVTVHSAREITIAAQTPLLATLDGEVAGATPATFTVIPKALRVQG